MNRNSGNVAWRSLFFNSLVFSGILIFNCDRSLAQVIPDNTLGNFQNRSIDVVNKKST
ncbi:MAG: hypothetical protein QNJ53_02365 [Pleurocapsa sp. MO_192.B19]|nr:hypothetical protein [Pleurocapsa sp. MO_192.B19]